jgi:phage terminase small subunit
VQAYRGNPGKRAPPRSEPDAIPDPPEPATDFCDIAQAEWDRLRRCLEPIGLWSMTDQSALRTLCYDWALMMYSRRAGELNEYNKAFQRWSRLMPHFGLTPSARTQLGINRDKREQSIASILDAASGERGKK